MKARKYAAVLLSALMLSSCGERIPPKLETQERVPIEQLLPEAPKPPEGGERISEGRLSYEVKKAWQKDSGSGAYIDDETRSAYMFITSGQDKALSPQEILDSYAGQTGSDVTASQPVSEELTDSAGLKYRTAVLEYSEGGSINDPRGRGNRHRKKRQRNGYRKL